MSHPVRGAWIEIFNLIINIGILKSHPVRGAWIEIWMDGMEIRFVFSRIP